MSDKNNDQRETCASAFRRIPMARPYHSPEIERAVLAVLRSGMLIQGKVVEEFEARLAEYIGCKHVVAVSSGTAALHLAFLALGVKPGDEVITTPFSFAATAAAIAFCGATPVFADIDPRTFNLDAASIEGRISSRTVGIEPVHLYGQPAEMDAILELASRHGLFVVEDAAQAIGAQYRGRKVGTIGDVTCFSTYSTKNLHTMEGGFIATDDDDVAARVRRLRNVGQDAKYYHTETGYNYRMTEVAAAIGREQVALIDEFTRVRRANAARLTQAIRSMGVPGITPPFELPHATHVFHQYTVLVDPEQAGCSREGLAAALKAVGVETGVHYPRPIYTQPCFAGMAGAADACPVTEHTYRRVLSLPVHAGLSPEDVEHVAHSLSRAVATARGGV